MQSLSQSETTLERCLEDAYFHRSPSSTLTQDRSRSSRTLTSTNPQYKPKIPLALALLVVRLRKYDPVVVGRWLPHVRTKIRLLFATLSRYERRALKHELEKMGCTDFLKNYHPSLTAWGSCGVRMVQTLTMDAVRNGDWVDLSCSKCWELSIGYYEQSGVEAWTSNSVPCEISSCRFIALQYKGVIDAWQASLGRTSEPGHSPSQGHTYIVEVGSGHCALAYRLARALSEDRMSVHGEGGNACGITVVMTDFHAGVIQEQMKRQEFRELIEQGVLDGAVLDLNAPNAFPLRLLSSGKVIPEKPNARVVFVLNYVLDSLPFDLFKLERKEGALQLWKGVVAKQSPRLSGIRLVKTTNEPPELRNLLESSLVDNADVQWLLWPTGALRALASLRSFPNPDQLFIVGDKMVDSLDASNWADSIPGLDRHGNGGCMSVAVDPVILQTSAFSGMHWMHSTDARMEESFGVSIFYGRKASSLAMDYHFPPFFVADYVLSRGYPGFAPKALNDVLTHFNHDYTLFELLRWRSPIKAARQQLGLYSHCWMECWRHRFAMTAKESCQQAYQMSQWCHYTQDATLSAFAVNLLRKSFVLSTLPTNVPLKGLLCQVKQILGKQKKKRLQEQKP